MTINERTVQNWLWRYHKSGSELVMPNYTPGNWWECDVIVVTKSLMWHEYEIKLTKHDFHEDTKKARVKWRPHLNSDGVTQFGPVTETTKHLQLAGASTAGPNCFWFVMPRDLVPLCEIPLWAGVKWIVPRGKWLAFEVARKAPRLHSQPVERKVIEHARSVCYWRYWNERSKAQVSA